jgi:ankyrin repeat protein
MKPILLTIFATLLFVGCSDPEAEANKLFTEASVLFKEAEEVQKDQPIESYKKRKLAVALIEIIPTQYPSSSLSVKIAEGNFKVRGQSVDRIKEELEDIFEVVKSGDIEFVTYLIDNGADVNAKDVNGSHSLHYAASRGHRELSQFLVSKGANVSNKDNYGNTPLHDTASLDVAKLLIKNGADVKAKNNNGASPLHFTTSTEIAELLIKYGAVVNAKYGNGVSPLHHAAKRNDVKMSQLLIAKGANVKFIDGEIPLETTSKEVAGLIWPSYKN